MHWSENWKGRGWPGLPLSFKPSMPSGPNAVKKALSEQESHFWYSKAPFYPSMPTDLHVFSATTFHFFLHYNSSWSILKITRMTLKLYFLLVMFLRMLDGDDLRNFNNKLGLLFDNNLLRMLDWDDLRNFWGFIGLGSRV